MKNLAVDHETQRAFITQVNEMANLYYEGMSFASALNYYPKIKQQMTLSEDIDSVTNLLNDSKQQLSKENCFNNLCASVCFSCCATLPVVEDLVDNLGSALSTIRDGVQKIDEYIEEIPANVQLSAITSLIQNLPTGGFPDDVLTSISKLQSVVAQEVYSMNDLFSAMNEFLKASSPITLNPDLAFMDTEYALLNAAFASPEPYYEQEEISQSVMSIAAIDANSLKNSVDSWVNGCCQPDSDGDCKKDSCNTLLKVCNDNQIDVRMNFGSVIGMISSAQSTSAKLGTLPIQMDDMRAQIDYLSKLQSQVPQSVLATLEAAKAALTTYIDEATEGNLQAVMSKMKAFLNEMNALKLQTPPSIGSSHSKSCCSSGIFYWLYCKLRALFTRKVSLGDPATSPCDGTDILSKIYRTFACATKDLVQSYLTLARSLSVLDFYAQFPSQSDPIQGAVNAMNVINTNTNGTDSPCVAYYGGCYQYCAEGCYGDGCCIGQTCGQPDKANAAIAAMQGANNELLNVQQSLLSDPQVQTALTTVNNFFTSTIATFDPKDIADAYGGKGAAAFASQVEKVKKIFASGASVAIKDLLPSLFGFLQYAVQMGCQTVDLKLAQAESNILQNLFKTSQPYIQPDSLVTAVNALQAFQTQGLSDIATSWSTADKCGNCNGCLYSLSQGNVSIGQEIINITNKFSDVQSALNNSLIVQVSTADLKNQVSDLQTLGASDLANTLSGLGDSISPGAAGGYLDQIAGVLAAFDASKVTAAACGSSDTSAPNGLGDTDVNYCKSVAYFKDFICYTKDLIQNYLTLKGFESTRQYYENMGAQLSKIEEAQGYVDQINQALDYTQNNCGDQCDIPEVYPCAKKDSEFGPRTLKILSDTMNKLGAFQTAYQNAESELVVHFCVQDATDHIRQIFKDIQEVPTVDIEAIYGNYGSDFLDAITKVQTQLSSTKIDIPSLLAALENYFGYGIQLNCLGRQDLPFDEESNLIVNLIHSPIPFSSPTEDFINAISDLHGIDVSSTSDVNVVVAGWASDGVCGHCNECVQKGDGISIHDNASGFLQKVKELQGAFQADAFTNVQTGDLKAQASNVNALGNSDLANQLSNLADSVSVDRATDLMDMIKQQILRTDLAKLSGEACMAPVASSTHPVRLGGRSTRPGLGDQDQGNCARVPHYKDLIRFTNEIMDAYLALSQYQSTATFYSEYQQDLSIGDDTTSAAKDIADALKFSPGPCDSSCATNSCCSGNAYGAATIQYTQDASDQLTNVANLYHNFEEALISNDLQESIQKIHEVFDQIDEISDAELEDVYGPDYGVDFVKAIHGVRDVLRSPTVSIDHLLPALESYLSFGLQLSCNDQGFISQKQAVAQYNLITKLFTSAEPYTTSSDLTSALEDVASLSTEQGSHLQNISDDWCSAAGDVCYNCDQSVIQPQKNFTICDKVSDIISAVQKFQGAFPPDLFEKIDVTDLHKEAENVRALMTSKSGEVADDLVSLTGLIASMDAQGRIQEVKDVIAEFNNDKLNSQASGASKKELRKRRKH